MCDFGISEVAIAASVLGTAVSAYGAYSQGQAQSKAAEYQAAVDRNNATIAGYNSKIAEDAQAAKTQAIERQGTLRAAAQRAALGASGVDIGSGSALNVQGAARAGHGAGGGELAGAGRAHRLRLPHAGTELPRSGLDGERVGGQLRDGGRDQRRVVAVERGRSSG